MRFVAPTSQTETGTCDVVDCSSDSGKKKKKEGKDGEKGSNEAKESKAKPLVRNF